MEETFKAGTSYRGHIRHVISNDIRPNDMNRITGPFDLAGRWNMFRTFFIPQQNEANNQFKPIDTLFEAKLWFFGEWPRDSAAHDVKLFIGEKLIWSLAGDLVCSGKESWKGHFPASSFQWSQQPNAHFLSERPPGSKFDPQGRRGPRSAPRPPRPSIRGLHAAAMSTPPPGSSASLAHGSQKL